jgi:hypothetical protein
VLADFVLVHDFADPHADLLASDERAVLDASLDLMKFLLGCREQRLALVGP